MRKVALVFLLAVLAPSLVLAWLAVRSIRDQQFLLERQQSLLYQGVTDSLAKAVNDYITQQQHEFSSQVQALTSAKNPRAIASEFDQDLRTKWPLVEVGFCVTLSGNLICPTCPPPFNTPELRSFCLDNSAFLGNRETVQVYWNANNNSGQAQQQQAVGSNTQFANNSLSSQQILNLKMNRAVNPQKSYYKDTTPNSAADQQGDNVSKLSPAEAEFGQLVGNDMDGMLARYLQNKLKLMFWHRLPSDPDLVFGAQLSLPHLVAGLRDVVKPAPELTNDICVALLDDTARPVALSHRFFRAAWKRPFVATEIGEALPHWEVAAYLVNPERLTQAVCTANLILSLVIATLVIAISVGGWLIVTDLNRQLALARQKTDFVSNVSHELKTPLTSIRMFSELLADQRVTDPDKQRSYLHIITAEAARLTRLINNVLDFSRMERGEKKYNIQDTDLGNIVRETVETYRPHLENNGFQLDCAAPRSSLPVRADADAIAQVIVNLLSNAEKYSNGEKRISIEARRRDGPLPCAEVRILDRGPGVPRGSEEKIFEKFYRAHDSLSSGIQGSGLGLTLARQIARAHGGDVVYEPREGGGSSFVLRLPLKMA